jgi:hypothetical protein
VTTRFSTSERALLRELAKRAPKKTGGWSRHLKGWQAGLVAVSVAWLGVLLVIPRAAPPDHLPLPRVSPNERAALLSGLHDRARRAEAGELHPTARALGETIRRLGRYEHDRDRFEALEMHRRIEVESIDALRASPASLPVLRAYQALRFVSAVRRWEATGVEDDDLIELGGDLVQMLRDHAWVEEHARGRRVLPDDLALAVLHERRFNAVLERDHPLLAIDPVAERAWLAFAMRHPPRFAEQLDRDGADGAKSTLDARAARREAPVGGDSFVLRKLPDAAALVPGYPLDFARGIVWMRLGRWEPAAEAFAMYLDASPGGPFSLRARNHMRACLDQIATLR